jgi:hypothetical protein
MEITQDNFNQVEMDSKVKKEVGHLVKDFEIDLGVCITHEY